MPGDPQLAASEQCEKQAYDLILGDAGKVFDLSQEKDELRERYGRNTFGQSCLVARRLVERGVPYVTINYKGWDTHKQHFQAMRRQAAGAGQGHGHAAAGPVGPRPAGQHHRLVERRVRPHAQGPVGSRPGTAGAAITARSSPPWSPAADSRAATWSARRTPRAKQVKDRPVYPCDLIGSMYELLGIDPEAKLPHPAGPGGPRDAHRRGRREDGRTAEGDHVAVNGPNECSR